MITLTDIDLDSLSLVTGGKGIVDTLKDINNAPERFKDGYYFGSRYAEHLAGDSWPVTKGLRLGWRDMWNPGDDISKRDADMRANNAIGRDGRLWEGG